MYQFTSRCIAADQLICIATEKHQMKFYSFQEQSLNCKFFITMLENQGQQLKSNYLLHLVAHNLSPDCCPLINRKPSDWNRASLESLYDEDWSLGAETGASTI